MSRLMASFLIALMGFFASSQLLTTAFAEKGKISAQEPEEDPQEDEGEEEGSENQ